MVYEFLHDQYEKLKDLYHHPNKYHLDPHSPSKSAKQINLMLHDVKFYYQSYSDIARELSEVVALATGLVDFWED